MSTISKTEDDEDAINFVCSFGDKSKSIQQMKNVVLMMVTGC